MHKAVPLYLLPKSPGLRTFGMFLGAKSQTEKQQIIFFQVDPEWNILTSSPVPWLETQPSQNLNHRANQVLNVRY